MKFSRLFGLLAALLAAALWAAPAQAQASRTWVSGVGNDGNPCSRTAPCQTFAGAISKTAAGGEIDALDPGGFGQVTITKNLTIDGGGGQVASVLLASGAGITVSGSGIIVTLKNLSINGLGTASTGVSFTNGSRLNVMNCDIMGTTSYGIGFFPSVAGAGLYVSDTTIHGGAAYGIAISPVASGTSAIATLANVKLFQNGIGVIAQDNSKTTIVGSDISGNNFGGVIVTSASAAAIVQMQASSVDNNGGDGLSVSGAGTPRIRISNVRISANAGNSINGTAFVFSFGNNYIVDNGIDALPGGTLMPS